MSSIESAGTLGFESIEVGAVHIIRTETIDDTEDPDFTHQFELDYFFEEIQQMKVEIYDRDSKSEDLRKHFGV